MLGLCAMAHEIWIAAALLPVLARTLQSVSPLCDLLCNIEDVERSIQSEEAVTLAAEAWHTLNVSSTALKA